jgi:hypothetical protein
LRPHKSSKSLPPAFRLVWRRAPNRPEIIPEPVEPRTTDRGRRLQAVRCKPEEVGPWQVATKPRCRCIISIEQLGPPDIRIVNDPVWDFGRSGRNIQKACFPVPQPVLTGMYGLEDVSGAPAILKARLAHLNDPSDARLAVQPISQNLNILRGYVQDDLGHGQIVVVPPRAWNRSSGCSSWPLMSTTAICGSGRRSCHRPGRVIRLPRIMKGQG